MSDRARLSAAVTSVIDQARRIAKELRVSHDEALTVVGGLAAKMIDNPRDLKSNTSVRWDDGVAELLDHVSRVVRCCGFGLAQQVVMARVKSVLNLPVSAEDIAFFEQHESVKMPPPGTMADEAHTVAIDPKQVDDGGETVKIGRLIDEA